MSKRVKEWARQARQQMIARLGGKCAECGLTSYEELTIDHLDGKDYDATGLSTDQRMCAYRKEEAAGVRLQILCHQCNSSKGNRHRRANPF